MILNYVYTELQVCNVNITHNKPDNIITYRRIYLEKANFNYSILSIHPYSPITLCPLCHSLQGIIIGSEWRIESECVCESPLFVVCSFLLRLLTYFWLDQHFHFTLLLFLDWLLLFRTCTCSNHVDSAASGRARRARILSQFSDWRVRGQQLQLTLLSLLLYLLMTDRLSYDPLPLPLFLCLSGTNLTCPHSLSMAYLWKFAAQNSVCCFQSNCECKIAVKCIFHFP